MRKAMNYHKRLPKFEVFDEIRMRVVPRFKTSGLSGDEWRTSVSVEIFFKGRVVKETQYRDMETAAAFLPGLLIEGGSPILDEVLAAEKALCDQPGCPEPWESEYEIIQEFSSRGEKLDSGDRANMQGIRRFCKKHLERGDCSREDSDRNYRVTRGDGPEASTNTEESPSVLGGVIDLR